MELLAAANRRTAWKSGLASAALLWSVCAGAAEIEAGFSVGLGYTDNIDRTPVALREETIAKAGTDFAVTQISRRIHADARGSLYRHEYLDDTYDGETVAAVDALVDFSIVPERFNWIIQENYGRTLFDPFMPDRPENRENLNFFTTGPTIILYRGERNESGMDLRFSTFDYEMRPFDNERRSGRVWVGREIRRDHMVSINAEVEEVEFDNGVTPTYDRRSGYLRYEAETGRNQFTIDVGYTEQEILTQTDDGVTFAIGWVRRISSRSEFFANVGRQFADQANVFRYQQDISRDPDSIGDFTENGSPFIWNYADVGYSLNGERTTLSAQIGVSEEEYETQGNLDRKDARLGLYAQRDFTRSLYAGADVQFYKREFSDIDREDDTFFASAFVGYRLSASFDLSLRYSYFTRDSNAVANEFDENRAELTLTYTPAWGRIR